VRIELPRNGTILKGQNDAVRLEPPMPFADLLHELLTVFLPGSRSRIADIFFAADGP
jgi:hypothetical protein